MRKVSVIGSLVVALALVAAACTPPSGPAPRNWKVSPTSVKVIDPEDVDGGDEPYVIQIGFRSKIGVPGSSDTSIASQCYSRKLPPTNVGTPGTTVTIPPGSADIAFGDVQNLDIGDVLLELAPFEIFGTLAFVVERDGLFPDSCAISDAFRSLLLNPLEDALDLLIAAQPVPPTQEQLIQLIVNSIDDFLGALGSLIVAVFEGLGNPDDVIGIGVQALLPTAGAFTDLLNTAFGIAGFFEPGFQNGFIPIEDLPSNLKLRVGSLSTSSALFDFQIPGVHYEYRSAITP
jgi:hypothetical protein